MKEWLLISFITVAGPTIGFSGCAILIGGHFSTEESNSNKDRKNQTSTEIALRGTST